MVPLASFHPVFQGRQHTFRPDARFNPGPAVSDLSGRFSLFRHWGRLRFLSTVRHVSTFLPPLAPRPLRRFIATMEALTPVCLFPTHRSPCFTHSTVQTIPSPTTVAPRRRFITLRAIAQRVGLPWSFSAFLPGLLPSRVWASPAGRRLAALAGRIGFVILRTGRSPPVALHPASRRRSYSRLQAVAFT
jgi:hypothetical protein